MKRFLKSMAALLLACSLMAASIAQAEEAVGNQATSQTAGTNLKKGPGALGVSKKMKSMKKSKADKKASPSVVEKDSWICPMCHIKADKPGKCPECGMDMVKMPKNIPPKD